MPTGIPAFMPQCIFSCKALYHIGFNAIVAMTTPPPKSGHPTMFGFDITTMDHQPHPCGTPMSTDRFIDLARQTGKSNLTLEYILGQATAVAAQTEGMAAENVVPIIFSMSIPQLIGLEALQRIHRSGLPETLLLDIYMSWRTIYKRPPSSNADFTHFYSYFQDQLELVYEGISLQFPVQNTHGQFYRSTDELIAGELDFLINTTYRIGSHAEMHLAPTLAALPDHEFVFDSVRDVPGVDSLSLTMVHDPRMVSPGDEDPIEKGPTAKLKFDDAPVQFPAAPLQIQFSMTDLSSLNQQFVEKSTDDKDRYGF